MSVAGRAPEVIRTERLVGRRLTAADESLFLAFHRDPRVLSWLGGGDDEITEPENREWLDDKLRHWETHGFGLYALFEIGAAAPTGAVAVSSRVEGAGSPDVGAASQDAGAAVGRLVGRAGIQQVDPDVGEILGDATAIELMYALAYDFWSRGLGTEIAGRLLEVARHDLGRAEIIADTMPHNLRSRRVMEGLGFVYEREFWHDDHTMVLYRRALGAPGGGERLASEPRGRGRAPTL